MESKDQTSSEGESESSGSNLYKIKTSKGNGKKKLSITWSTGKSSEGQNKERCERERKRKRVEDYEDRRKRCKSSASTRSVGVGTEVKWEAGLLHPPETVEDIKPVISGLSSTIQDEDVLGLFELRDGRLVIPLDLIMRRLTSADSSGTGRTPESLPPGTSGLTLDKAIASTAQVSAAETPPPLMSIRNLPVRTFDNSLSGQQPWWRNHFKQSTTNDRSSQSHKLASACIPNPSYFNPSGKELTRRRNGGKKKRKNNRAWSRPSP